NARPRYLHSLPPRRSSDLVGEKGQFRVPVVFDNLIHKKEMPVTVGVFVNPGTFPPADPKGKGRSNRSFEYDTPSPQYVTFLEKRSEEHTSELQSRGHLVCR